MTMGAGRSQSRDDSFLDFRVLRTGHTVLVGKSGETL